MITIYGDNRKIRATQIIHRERQLSVEFEIKQGLQLKGVTCAVGKQKILADISLQVAGQEIVALVGPSGAGKTTLLRAIAGLTEIDQGKIEINGIDVAHQVPYRRNCAMLFQNYCLFPHLTVAQNLAFPLKRLKMTTSCIHSRVKSTAALLGLSALMKRYPETLSGGEQQRVALGKVLVREPDILMLDEPFAHLDLPLQRILRTEIHKIREKLAIPVLYVTHDQSEALAMGDRVAVMMGGILKQVAAPLDLYRHPCDIDVARFIGVPAINLIPGTVDNGHWVHPLFPKIKLTRAVTAGPAYLGIRPENIEIVTQGTTALVNRLEFCGAYSILYIQVGNLSLQAQMPTRNICSYKTGEKLQICLNEAEVQIFPQPNI